MHSVEHEDHQPYLVVWIHIGFIDEKSQERNTGLLHTRQGLGELMSPLRALLNTRSGRTGTSVRQLRILGEQLKEHGGDVKKVEFLLKISPSDPPLGWLLSEVSRSRIRAQLGDPENLDSTYQILQLLRDSAAGTAIGAGSTR